MPRRIVLFGASGYTGRLVAEALVRRDLPFVLAGRNYQRLAALALTLSKGLDVAVADAHSPRSLLELIEPDDVLVTTVGPYVRAGVPVVQAAIRRNATYLDACSEPAFIRHVFENLDGPARDARVTVLPSFAYQYLAGTLGAALALEAVGGEAVAVDVAYFLRGPQRGAVSAGSHASAGAAAFRRQHAWRGGELQTVLPADRMKMFRVDGHDRPALAIGGAEHLTVPRVAPAIREVGVFAGRNSGRFPARAVRTFVAGVARLPRVAGVMGALARVSVGRVGPDAEQRERTGAEVIASALGDGGAVLRTVRLRCVNPYTFSAEVLAWAADILSKDGGVARGGVLGPVEAFGLGPLREAVAEAGLADVNEENP